MTLFESLLTVCLLLFVLQFPQQVEKPLPPHSLKDVRKDGTLFIGVLLNPIEYYVHQGRVRGFSYALGKAMAEAWGVQVQFQVYYTYENLSMALVQNEIDVMAVAEQPFPEGRLFFAYTQPIIYSDVLRVQHKDSLAACHTIGLVASPTLVEAAAAMQRRLPDSLRWRFFRASSYQLMEAVEDGCLESTLYFERYWHATAYQYPHVKVVDTLAKRVPLCWAVRKGNDSMLAAINTFLQDYSKTKEWARLCKKYTDPTSREHTRIAYTLNSQPFGTISRYDAYFKKYGAVYGIDWQLLAALVYQESRFRHDIVGKGGTYGLMQLAPVTASRFGVSFGSSPEQQINGGCRYLHFLRQKIAKEGVCDSAQLVPMVIAAYNAGSGHLVDAIALAKAEGLNASVWEPNGIREALLMLGEWKYAHHPAIRHGRYHGARHTIRYVQAILDRNDTYKAIIHRDSLIEIN